jgi:arginine/lysine/ornithine decarboxylase
MDAGADVCVTSVHKMGSGLEQGSVFHLQGDLIAPEVLKARADLLGTTSPSVLLYAALDGWRRQMVEHGRSLYDRALSLADHRRISAQLTHADEEDTADALLDAFRAVAAHAADLRPAPARAIPDPPQLRLEQVMLPRDAFFGPAAQVPWDRAAGRVAAEMLTPYPPGIPAALPGERLTRSVVDYLRTGVDAGMVVPDAADSAVKSMRVVTEE